MDSTAALTFPTLPALAGALDEPVPSVESRPGLPTLTDRALLERVARGDQDAFAVLYRRYERPVFGVLVRMAGQRALAEEWLQEAFTRVWLGAETHDPARGEVKPWIYAIALNTARSELGRKRHRTPHVSIDDLELDLPGEGAADIASPARRRAKVGRRGRGAARPARLHAGGRDPALQPGALVRRDLRGDRGARGDIEIALPPGRPGPAARGRPPAGDPPVSHPGPGDLILLHFGETGGEKERAALSAHVAGCHECGVSLAELAALERAVGTGSAGVPPADGLERVLSRVEGLRPARARRARERRVAAAVLPSLAAAAGAGVAVHHGGLVAALALFGAGVVLTLALAPVLILESQRRS